MLTKKQIWLKIHGTGKDPTKRPCPPAANDCRRRVRAGRLGQHQLPLPGGQPRHRDLLRRLPARPPLGERSASRRRTHLQVFKRNQFFQILEYLEHV
jgi:hypothetical protein